MTSPKSSAILLLGALIACSGCDVVREAGDPGAVPALDLSASSTGNRSGDSSGPALDSTEAQLWAWASAQSVATRIDFILRVMGTPSFYPALANYYIESPPDGSNPGLNPADFQTYLDSPSSYTGQNGAQYELMLDQVLLPAIGQSSYSASELGALSDTMIDAFTAADIYKFKAGRITGCSGHARVFQNLAAKVGLNTRYVLTATATKYDNACYPTITDPPPGSRRAYRKASPEGDIDSGHQVVAVQFEDGLWRVIETENDTAGLTPSGYAQWKPQGTSSFVEIAVSDPYVLASSPTVRNEIYFPDIYAAMASSPTYNGDPMTIHSEQNYNIISAVTADGAETNGTERTNIYTSGSASSTQCNFPVLAPIPEPSAFPAGIPNPQPTYDCPANGPCTVTLPNHIGCNQFCTVIYVWTACNSQGDCAEGQSAFPPSPPLVASAQVSCAPNPNEVMSCTETCDQGICTSTTPPLGW